MKLLLLPSVLLIAGLPATAQERPPRGYPTRQRVTIRPHGADIYRRFEVPRRPSQPPPNYWGHRTYARPYLGPYPHRLPRYGARGRYSYDRPYAPFNPWVYRPGCR